MNTQVEQLNNQGVKFFLNGNFKEAKQKYNEALDLLPSYATALNNMGMLLLQEKEFKQAEEMFEKAIQQEEKPAYILNLGHAFANQNLLDDAEKCYTKSIRLNPSSLMAWKSLAALHQFMKQFHDSVQLWEKIILDLDDSVYFKIEMAKDLLALKRDQEALDILSKAANQNDSQEKTWYYIGYIHFLHKNFGLAEKALKNSLATNPDYEPSRHLLGSVYLGHGQLNSAIEQWNFILKNNPLQHNVRIDKGVTLLAHQMKDEALKELNIVLDNDSNNFKALYYKGLVLLELNQDKEIAKTCFEKVVNTKTEFSQKAKQILKSL